MGDSLVIDNLTLAEYLLEHGPWHTDLYICKMSAVVDNEEANADDDAIEDDGEMMSLEFRRVSDDNVVKRNFPVSIRTINIISSWLDNMNAREQRIRVRFSYYFTSVTLGFLEFMKDAVIEVSVHDDNYAMFKASIAVALKIFLSFPNLERINFDGGLFIDNTLQHY